jgi:hypothetical protein
LLSVSARGKANGHELDDILTIAAKTEITSQVLRSIKRMVLMRLIFRRNFDKLDKLFEASLTGDYKA